MSAKEKRKDLINSLAEEMAKDVSYDAGTGENTNNSGEFFVKYLAKAEAGLEKKGEVAEITPAVVDRVRDLRNIITVANGKAAIIVSEQTFKDNKELDSTKLTMPWGSEQKGVSDYIESKVERKVEFKVAGNSHTHYLNLTTKLVAKGAANTGDLAAVVEEGRIMGREAFGSGN